MKVHDEWTRVPCVSRFHGVVITMYIDENRHPGRPYFHAIYGGGEASVDIETAELVVGRLPRPVVRKIRKWARLHRDELRRNWQIPRSSGRLTPIAPLP